MQKLAEQGIYMDTYCFEYKGHRVVVVADDDENAQWGWSYSIDSEVPMPSRTHTFPRAIEAIEKAVRHSKRRIDVIPKLRALS